LLPWQQPSAKSPAARLGLLTATGPWGLPDNGIAAEIERAGFTAVRASRHQLPITFDGDPRQLLQTLAASGVAATVAALGDAGQRALAAAIEETAAPLMHDGAIRSETAAQLVTATTAS